MGTALSNLSFTIFQFQCLYIVFAMILMCLLVTFH